MIFLRDPVDPESLINFLSRPFVPATEVSALVNHLALLSITLGERAFVTSAMVGAG